MQEEEHEPSTGMESEHHGSKIRMVNNVGIVLGGRHHHDHKTSTLESKRPHGRFEASRSYVNAHFFFSFGGKYWRSSCPNLVSLQTKRSLKSRRLALTFYDKWRLCSECFGDAGGMVVVIAPDGSTVACFLLSSWQIGKSC
jgi:hypothetical protein